MKLMLSALVIALAAPFVAQADDQKTCKEQSVVVESLSGRDAQKVFASMVANKYTANSGTDFFGRVHFEQRFRKIAVISDVELNPVTECTCHTTRYQYCVQTKKSTDCVTQDETRKYCPDLR